MLMIKTLTLLSSFFILLSCARVQTLNMEKHTYSERPNHIIWIQLAGLSDDHLPLLRFNVSDVNYRTNLEKSDCIGKMWTYNLYDLRPSATQSFLSQLLGTKNIKNQCSDFKSKPVWEYLSEMGYFSSIIENGANEEESLDKMRNCPGAEALKLSRLRFYRMGSDSTIKDNTSQKMFHYQDSLTSLQEILLPGFYYDKSCQKSICYSSLTNNFKTLWTLSLKDQPQSFFLIRDFSFLNALRKKDISSAKESMQEIERIVTTIKSLKREDVMVVVTGAESMGVEYPNEGKDWAEFEKSGKNIIYKKSALLSPVFASGPLSENFCGIFEESDMPRRLLVKPEMKVFNWDFVNPFSN